MQPFGANSGGLAIVLDSIGRPMVGAYDNRQSNNNYSGFAVFRHDYVYSQSFE